MGEILHQVRYLFIIYVSLSIQIQVYNHWRRIWYIFPSIFL